MSLQAVVEAIRQQAEKKVDGITADAQAQADRIRAQARDEAERIRQEAQQSAIEAAGREATRLQREADLEARQIRRGAAQALFDQAVARARERLDDLRDHPGYEQMLQRLTQEAYDALKKSLREEEQAVVAVSPVDEPLVAALKRERGLDYAIHADEDGMRGVMARSPDRRVVVDNRLDSRLAQALPALRRAFIAELLERDEG